MQSYLLTVANEADPDDRSTAAKQLFLFEEVPCPPSCQTEAGGTNAEQLAAMFVRRHFPVGRIESLHRCTPDEQARYFRQGCEHSGQPNPRAVIMGGTYFFNIPLRMGVDLEVS